MAADRTYVAGKQQLGLAVLMQDSRHIAVGCVAGAGGTDCIDHKSGHLEIAWACSHSNRINMRSAPVVDERTSAVQTAVDLVDRRCLMEARRRTTGSGWDATSYSNLSRESAHKTEQGVVRKSRPEEAEEHHTEPSRPVKSHTRRLLHRLGEKRDDRKQMARVPVYQCIVELVTSDTPRCDLRSRLRRVLSRCVRQPAAESSLGVQ